MEESLEETEVGGGLCIMLDYDTRIYELDSLNYGIQIRKVTKTGANMGTEYWVTQSYHNTISSVASKLIHSGIKGKNLTELKSIINCVDTNTKTLIECMKKVAYE